MLGLVKYIICLLVVVTFSACERREIFSEYHSYLNVELIVDWSNLEEFGVPQGASAWFYPKEIFRTNEVDHFYVPLEEGNYELVLFSYSMENYPSLNFVRSDSVSTFRITAAHGGLLADSESFALDVQKGIEVSDKAKAVYGYGLGGATDSVLVVNSIFLEPKRIVQRSQLSLKLKGIHNLFDVRASIVGMADAFIVDSMCRSSSTESFELDSWEIDGSYGEGELKFSFNSFGLQYQNAGKQEEWKGLFEVDFLLVDKETVLTYSIPLTGEVHIVKPAQGYELCFEVGFKDGDIDIVLPDVVPADSEGGGFDAEVDSWGDEQEENLNL